MRNRGCFRGQRFACSTRDLSFKKILQALLFIQELKFDVIEDFPTFQDKRLYVLTACGIEMYGLNDLLYEGCLPLPDTSYTYCKVGGKEVGTFVLEKE